jgi:hypothetical protein
VRSSRAPESKRFNRDFLLVGKEPGRYSVPTELKLLDGQRPVDKSWEIKAAMDSNTSADRQVYAAPAIETFIEKTGLQREVHYAGVIDSDITPA